MSSTTFESVPATVETTTSPWLSTTGRVLFAAPFAVFGVNHLMMPGAMAGMVPAWVPGGGSFWVVLTGLAMIAAAVSIGTNRLTKVSAPLLALLLATYVVTLHLPALLGGDQMAIMGLLKDTSLIGGALFLAARSS